jgi:hypothetical protein
MTAQDQIDEYLDVQPDAKRDDMRVLHHMVQQIIPGGRLWFLDGRNEAGKVVSNPSIGYGSRTTKYADGKTREFYQIGISANTTGISVYILGIDDKTYLARTYGKDLGKATVSGYCVKFKRLADVNVAVLESAMRFGVSATNED